MNRCLPSSSLCSSGEEQTVNDKQINKKMTQCVEETRAMEKKDKEKQGKVPGEQGGQEALMGRRGELGRSGDSVCQRWQPFAEQRPQRVCQSFPCEGQNLQAMSSAWVFTLMEVGALAGLCSNLGFKRTTPQMQQPSLFLCTEF